MREEREEQFKIKENNWVLEMYCKHFDLKLVYVYPMVQIYFVKKKKSCFLP